MVSFGQLSRGNGGWVGEILRLQAKGSCELALGASPDPPIASPMVALDLSVVQAGIEGKIPGLLYSIVLSSETCP